MRTVSRRWIAWCSLMFCAGLCPAGLSQAQSTPNPTPPPSAAATKVSSADKAAKPRAPRTKKAQPAPVASNAAPAPTTPAPSSKPGQPDKPVLAAANVKPAPPPPPAATPAAPPKPACTLAEAEQPRGGRLEVLSDAFGSAPVVRIAGKPARMIERRPDRVSVQVPADSDGGPITLLHDGKTSSCGNLVIIGKNR